jgi:hypothetical protein
LPPLPARPTVSRLSPARPTRAKDDTGRPKRVRAHVWQQVPNDDRDEIRLRAARLFVTGINAEDAIKRAMSDLEAERAWRGDGHVGYAFHQIRHLLPDPCLGPHHPSFAMALRIARGAVETARLHRDDILKDGAPPRRAFVLRAWTSDTGKCLLTGRPLVEGCKFYGEDGVNPDALPYIREVARSFSEAVVEIARRMVADQSDSDKEDS